MIDENKVLDYCQQLEEHVTSSHFHEQGLMDDQVDPTEWSNYSWKVYNSLLDVIGKYDH